MSVWSGIAPALLKERIPAVVANQYGIQDRCAIAFTRAFYQALAGGLPIERAVAAGRIAIYNTDNHGRDWGVPVLYLRTGDGRLFEGAADAEARERSKQAAEADIRVRVSTVQAGGILTGLDAVKMLEGKVVVNISVGGAVLGVVTAAKVRHLSGGQLVAQVDANEVGEGGELIGAKIGTIGGSGRRRTKPAGAGRSAGSNRPKSEPPPQATMDTRSESAKSRAGR